ncbi:MULTISPECIES: DUF3060 domain-containing protein [Nocardiopsis]|uniref:DUF3060 domain-containing protein n=1 Tax=Nocardiopsis dassonvillei (strain ATCC 23218 / DSM 43111 / CIP 107115 / JCM 7437 / KCTC 9190 / NBRC 14626 / NCTC 10488 / NRRL B-5397 / IMRU 509) TaxID=446468 RepID=D7B722_NOCDD|nr:MULTISPECIES: DUF3060 domain-containing protein [Nocardiopsis]ADH65576.1 conserved hypothetical protein [Nocardiopsis dassonvillei subsp. dassonvillei DSM 43111]APC38268.1 hypothetical protein A9R04_04130 [Nocardiopsis dassonvillei]ASU56795.1 DUF3060 domain-containing protein [Nocardiopsis dassonvillei]MCK9872601.1 DUF3060 domain-containing protein [Nocardiopsis dassonvillei]NKY80304.1 DUF3060 domain-containing protein [Nocardiopsis dassonvillei]
MRSAAPAAALLAATAFWLTGCSVGIPGTDQEVSVDPDGVSVGSEDGEVSVDSNGDVSVGNQDGDVTLDEGGGISVDSETGDLTIATVEGSVTEECDGQNVNVTASGAEVVLNGQCGEVSILGNELTVHIGSADSIRVTGADNTVHHAEGEPSVTDIGLNNTVSAGGEATA